MTDTIKQLEEVETLLDISSMNEHSHHIIGFNSEDRKATMAALRVIKRIKDGEDWFSVEEVLPELGDYSVLALFDTGYYDMVHVEDVTAGLDNKGNQLYSKMYDSFGITHWKPLDTAEHVKMLLKEEMGE